MPDRLRIDLTDSQLRPAQPAEWRRVANITAEAFEDDPVNRWVFGKLASIRSMFRVLARDMYIRHGHCYLAGERGATMWLPPGAEASLTRGATLKFALGQLSHGTPGSIRRGLALADKMEAWHPSEPHMYLFTIGTTQAARGQGVGKALLRPVLEACDAAGVAVYLENSIPEKSGFYAAHGFERLGTFEIGGEGSPIMEPMWREARG